MHNTQSQLAGINQVMKTNPLSLLAGKLKLGGLVAFLLGIAFPVFGTVEINYGYDDLNRLTTVTRADGPAINYQYDVSGNATNQGVSNSPDTDNDSIANFVDADDDGDGMSDTFEVQYGFNPLNPSDAGLDNDGDGISNLAEYQAGTNPLQNNNPVPVPTLPDWGTYLLALVMLLIGVKQTARQGR